jgi:hypothetical protein
LVLRLFLFSRRTATETISMGAEFILINTVVAVGVVLLCALAIPALVLLAVSPRTSRATVAATKFLAWVAGSFVLLGLLGWFVHDSGADHPVGGPRPLPASTRSIHGQAATAETIVGQVAISNSRPDWVDRPAMLEEQTYRVEVKSGLYVTPAECQRGLNAAIAAAVERYVTIYFGDERAAALVNLEPAYLRQHLIRQPLYAETVDASVGPMQQLHALLEFDDEMRAELHRLWRQAFVSDRLRYVGGAFSLLLAAIAAAWGYLKLDLATRGAYTRRLRWAAALAILLMAAGAVGICVL